MDAAGLLAAWLIQCALQSIYFIGLLTPKKKEKKTAAVFTAAQLPPMALCYLFVSDGLMNGLVRWVLAAASVLALCRVFFSDSWKTIGIAVCGIYLLIFLDSFFLVFLFQIFGIPAGEMLEGTMEAAGSLVFNGMYFLSIVLVVVIKKRKLQQWLHGGVPSEFIVSAIILFLAQAAAYMMFLWFPAASGVTFSNGTVMAGAALCIAADVLLLCLLLEQLGKERLAFRMKLMEKQSRLELSYYTSVNEKIQETRRLKHDFNNQLQTAYRVMAQGGREEAEALLRQLEERIGDSEPAVCCSNPVINAIVWDKKKEAGERGVALKADIRLPEETGISKADLCGIFSGMLEEGLRAAALCEMERTVSVTAYKEDGYCVIETEYTVSRENEAKDREAQGDEGSVMPVLREIARRYEGGLTAEKGPGSFRAAIRLKDCKAL